MQQATREMKAKYRAVQSKTICLEERKVSEDGRKDLNPKKRLQNWFLVSWVETALVRFSFNGPTLRHWPAHFAAGGECRW